MRTTCLHLLPLLAVACDAGSSESRATSGPIESIFKRTSDGIRLHARRHPLALADLPISDWVGLPVSGTIELDAALTVPSVRDRPDHARARGTLGFRCVGTCTLGDDVARLLPSEPDALNADGLPFAHLDFTTLEAQVTVADARARVTHWRFASPDLELHVELSLTLATNLPASRLDGCLRFRPTDALRLRAPTTHMLFSLMTGIRGPDDLQHIQLTGTIAAPRFVARICGPDAPPPPTSRPLPP